jgi:hypothetical protein
VIGKSVHRDIEKSVFERIMIIASAPQREITTRINFGSRIVVAIQSARFSDPAMSRFPNSSMPARPLRIIFRRHYQAIAHMNDAVADFGCFGIVRDHQHGLAKLLVGVAQHLQDDI